MTAQPDWQRLDTDEASALHPCLTQAFGSRLGRFERLRLDQQALGFVHDGMLVRLRGGSAVAPVTRYAVVIGAGAACLPIRFSPRIIEELNRHHALILNRETLPAYIGFCGQFTRHGQPARTVLDDERLTFTQTADSVTMVDGYWHGETGAQRFACRIDATGLVHFADDATSGAETAS